ncbi:MAG: DUF3306 domain-containing protein [Pseudomonadota bacterium]
MSDTDNPLARWSRRKQAARQNDTPEKAEPDAPPSVPEPEPSEEVYLKAHDLPDPDSLQQGDDFSAFLREGVPDALRNRALRRLWGSNPVLANLDGLIDYGADFTDSALVPKVLNTAYTVGRGFVTPDEPEPAATTAPAAPNPDDIVPNDTLPDDARPDDVEPDDARPDNVEPDDARPDEPAIASADQPLVVTSEVDSEAKATTKAAAPLPVETAAPVRRMRFSREG